MLRILILALTLTAGAIGQATELQEGDARKWTDNTGKISVVAEFIEVNSGEAVLKKSDGTIIKVPLNRLSPSDQEFIEALTPLKNAEAPEKSLTNSIGMKFVLIPAGEFMMGGTDSPLAAPEHKVRITKPFYLGVTEITQEQYEKIMGENPSSYSKTGDDANDVEGIDTSNFPVENVSWDDAVEFCRKLSAKEGKTYRLPTEAEWEYACCAGSTSRYCFGDDGSQLDEYAWFAEDSNRRTHPVGTKKPNAWGIHDMHGNVLEWCQDWFDPPAGTLDYYAGSPTEGPPGPSTGSIRVFRGGGWFSSAWYCLSSYRSGIPSSSRLSGLGFRVARDPSASQVGNQPPAETHSDSR